MNRNVSKLMNGNVSSFCALLGLFLATTVDFRLSGAGTRPPACCLPALALCFGSKP